VKFLPFPGRPGLEKGVPGADNEGATEREGATDLEGGAATQAPSPSQIEPSKLVVHNTPRVTLKGSRQDPRPLQVRAVTQTEEAIAQIKLREAGRHIVSQQEPKNPLNPPSSHFSPVSTTPLPQRGKSGKKGRSEGIIWAVVTF